MDDALISARTLSVNEWVAPLSAPALDPLFWPASRAGVESAWAAHVPFAHWLVAAERPERITELGTHNGVSYAAFCEAVQRERLDCRCLAVDTWQGDEQAGFYGAEVLTELRRFHDARYAGFSELLQMRFDEALGTVADGSVDLLHIDGLHTYEAVRHDFEAWRGKLSGRGVVLLHDTNVRQEDFGVWRLFAELAREYPAFEFLHGHGLGVVAVGPECGEAVLGLTRLSGAEAGTVRERFSFLGERWHAEVLASNMRAGVGEIARQHAEALQAQVSGLRACEARCDGLVGELEAARGKVAALEQTLAERERAGEERERAALDQASRREAAARQEAARLRAEASGAGRRHQATLGELASTLRIVGELKEAVGALELERHGLSGLLAERERLANQAIATAETRAYEAERSAIETERSVQGELAYLRREVWRAEAERGAVMRAATWRAMAPVRGVAGLVPGPLRRGVRQGAGLAGAAVRGRLRSALRARSALRRDAEEVARSALFDAGWYRAQNPDVAISGVRPALHYAQTGEAEGRDPGPRFSVRRYAERHPEAVGLLLLDAARRGLEADGMAPALTAPAATPAAETDLQPIVEAPLMPAPQAAPAEAEPPDVDALLHERFRELRPLRVYAAPQSRRRLTVVTDSINAGSLYGGVGTALILATLAARRLGAGLRLATRIEAPETGNIGPVLAAHGVDWDGNIEFVHAPWEGAGNAVPMGPGDLVLTTSWWTTWAVRQSVPRARIAYLLQEDERMFYPFGDEHLRASETLRDAELTYVVNSRLLLQHLQGEGLAPGAVAFEPSFPRATYHARQEDGGGKRQFFFYARPAINARNLYWRGLEALAAAIEQGVLDPQKWDFNFVGKAAADLRLPRGARPRLIQGLPWAEYAAMVRRMDLGLSLMYTPHPSYPPLDLAASGAVVVTNRFGVKTSLAEYSPNILCADLDVESLAAALRDGARLAGDRARRTANFEASGLQRDWAVSAAPAVERLAAWADGVPG